ncbi:protein phosphatase 2C domain-containing protein [Kribbella sp. NPDC051770]|uniref:protein phosphatase 2C domain-containing protein n=1 Tax=Kribbella sp. NPDC051770 TaxID=3155413 RepID=UPI0034410FF7
MGTVEIWSVCEGAPDRVGGVNEDLVVTGPDFVVVLDGATAPAGVESGCRHDVSWLVRQLGMELSFPLVGRSADSLVELLAGAIDGVRKLHVGTCDLSNPDSPSSTVAMVRVGAESVEHLVLADSPVVLRAPGGEVTAVVDDRVDYLPEYTVEAVRKARNQAGGFWVASTRPDAAFEAVSGVTARADVASVAVMTDGASRYAERYGHSWGELVGVLETGGPRELIDRVRAYDAAAEPGAFRGKRHDDASAVLLRLS